MEVVRLWSDWPTFSVWWTALGLYLHSSYLKVRVRIEPPRVQDPEQAHPAFMWGERPQRRHDLYSVTHLQRTRSTWIFGWAEIILSLSSYAFLFLWVFTCLTRIFKKKKFRITRSVILFFVNVNLGLDKTWGTGSLLQLLEQPISENFKTMKRKSVASHNSSAAILIACGLHGS